MGTPSFWPAAVLLLALLAACSAEAPPSLPELTAVPPSPTASATPFTPATIPVTAAPSVLPTPRPTARPTEEPLSEGFEFELDPGLATSADLRERPIVPADAPGGPWPAFTRLELAGYPIETLSGPPGVDIYRARELAGLSAVERVGLTTLAKLLAERPDLVSTSALPDPPGWIGLQENAARPVFLDFRNGSGLRYLAWSGEGDSGELFYVYLGLGEDGSDYLVAVLPVDYQPGAAALASLDQSGRANRLAAAQPENFFPDLNTLDRFITSWRAVTTPPQAPITAGGRLPLVLFYPPEEGLAVLRQPLAIEGYTQPGVARALLVSLLAGDHVLARRTVFSGIDGRYLLDLPVPPAVMGPVMLVVEGDNERVSRPLTAVADPYAAPEGGPAVTLSRPAAGRPAAAGVVLFFEGTAAAPVNGEVTVAVLINDCTTPIARQVISLAEETRPQTWRAVLQPPALVTGPACAAAWTGTPGVGAWREMRVSITLVEADSAAAPAAELGNPTNEVYVAGTEAVFYGSLLGPDRRVVLTLTAESGEVLAEGRGFAGADGYWEVALPLLAAGPARLAISLPGDPAAPPFEIPLEIVEPDA